MKTTIITEIGWQGALTAVWQLAEKISAENPGQFTVWDAERLETIARLIRSTCPQESL